MKLNLFLLFLILSLLFACAGPTPKKSALLSQKETILPIPDQTVDKSALHFNTQNSTWTLDGQLYAGFANEYYPDSTLKGKFEFLDGKMQNEAVHFFPDGHPKLLETYYQGKLHGEKKMWSSDAPHILVAQLNFYQGKMHGEQKKWYPTGELFKKLNLDMGREKGIQQAFRKNGNLYANYEALNGRIFGLKKAALCFDLESEKIRETE